jgi:hypothetical protein
MAAAVEAAASTVLQVTTAPVRANVPTAAISRAAPITMPTAHLPAVKAIARIDLILRRLMRS